MKNFPFGPFGRWLAFLGCLHCPLTLTAAPVSQLKMLSIDELMDVEVTSASRRAEPYQETATAMAVVTSEHIARSGATSIPDALRGVPGLHVARRNTHSWGVSSRGFSSINSEKLLVLSDTRSIYTPLFSGVYWDVQNYFLPDVERIEVIRGPGAALWGSNAVNGIINITTKSAADTHGAHLEVLAGTEESMAAFRHGGQHGADFHYRVFGKYHLREETRFTGTTADDGRIAHVGFRTDWMKSADATLTVQGDLYQGSIGLLAPPVTIIGRPGPNGDLEARVSGGNLLARWSRALSDGSEFQLRAYFDRTNRDDPSFTDKLSTFDLDAQHRFTALERHEITWGLNYRHMWNENRGKGIFAVAPPDAEDQVVSGFIQDQVALGENFRVTLGTKLEDNDFSGFEVQPSIRAAWDPAPGHTIWAALSRASRIPTRLERDIAIDVTDPASSNPLVRLLGNRDFAAEEVTAFELGWRWRISPRVHLDVAAFENRYSDLASLELGTPFAGGDGRTVVPIIPRNLTDGRARGIETVVTVTPRANWRISASHSFLDLELEPRGQDINRGRFYDGATPRHQFTVSSFLTLPRGLEFDVHWRNVGRLARLPDIVSGEGIPGYSELDIHLSWQISPGFRLTIVGQDLLHSEHVEFGTPAARGPIPRRAYVKASWQF